MKVELDRLTNENNLLRAENAGLKELVASLRAGVSWSSIHRR